MYCALEGLYKETYAIEMEASALLSPRSPYVDTAMENMGLQSSTILKRHISTEGVFEWVKEKLSNLGRHIAVSINKIWAKLTKADEATKQLIERASNDKTITLPISGKRIAAIGAVVAAIAAAVIITCKASMTGDEASHKKSESAYAKVKAMLKSLPKRNKGEKEEVEAGVVKKTALAIRDAIKNMGTALKNFFSSFKRGAHEAENAAENEGGSHKGIINRVKGMASGIRHIFTMLAEFASKCTGWIRGKGNKSTSTKKKDDVVKEGQVIVLNMRSEDSKNTA